HAAWFFRNSAKGRTANIFHESMLHLTQPGQTALMNARPTALSFRRGFFRVQHPLTKTSSSQPTTPPASQIIGNDPPFHEEGECSVGD
ncbi:MAG: hypothetical protein AAGF25_15430, partial [Pseudomonadota bacterium]